MTSRETKLCGAFYNKYDQCSRPHGHVGDCGKNKEIKPEDLEEIYVADLRDRLAAALADAEASSRLHQSFRLQCLADHLAAKDALSQRKSYTNGLPPPQPSVIELITDRDSWKQKADRLTLELERLKQEHDAVINNSLKNALEELDAARREATEWKDHAFRQSRETIQQGIKATDAEKEAADLCKERDSLQYQIGTLQYRLKETTDLMEAYRKAGMLEHERAEAGERMIAAMRKTRLFSIGNDYVQISVPASSELGKTLAQTLLEGDRERNGPT